MFTSGGGGGTVLQRSICATNFPRCVGEVRCGRRVGRKQGSAPQEPEARRSVGELRSAEPIGRRFGKTVVARELVVHEHALAVVERQKIAAGVKTMSSSRRWSSSSIASRRVVCHAGKIAASLNTLRRRSVP